ncbi:MAG: TolC family protein [Gemmataceae bacterium]|nr:TolC family protein [Gemmataceae bacterium]MDW8242831.1 TolC family protein [Thermogemmata sp.]
MSRTSTRRFLGMTGLGLLIGFLTTPPGRGDPPEGQQSWLAPLRSSTEKPFSITWPHLERWDKLLPPVGPVSTQLQTVSFQQPVKEEDENGPELSLGDCIALVLERHPHLKAVQASIAATEGGYKALLRFGTVGTLLSPDLEVRKQQAQRGLQGAWGEYQRVHNELVEDTIRLYYTAVYAQQQKAIADDVVEQLQDLIEILENIIKKATTPDELGGLTTEKVLTVKIGLREARQLQATAIVGRKRARAALRQLMHVEPDFAFRLKDRELPVMAQMAEVTREKVVEMALNRRPELALAAAGVDVFRLEVYAQSRIPFRRVVPTFASGADLHARDVPQAQRGKEYRPGGIIPEMPSQLVGSKYDRVARALNFSHKAEAMYENVRSLITLEAENAYLELELANEKLRLTKEKNDLAQELLKLARKNIPLAKTGREQIYQVEVLAAKAQADYVEAVYQHLLTLAALERITAGGITPAFPGRSRSVATPTPSEHAPSASKDASASPPASPEKTKN